MQGILFEPEERKSPKRGEKGRSLRRNNSPIPGPFPLNTVQLLDCLEGMKLLPDNSVDVAICDPPYNASKGNSWSWDNSTKLKGFGGNWNKVREDWDDMPLMDYLEFTLSWLEQVKRVVKPTGSLWLHGTYHNMGILNFACQLLKIEIINEVIWFKRNSFPNLSGRRLTASHETILWAHTGGEKNREYFFNYDGAKAMTCPEDGLKEPGKQMRTVWDIPNNKERSELSLGKHPTQKPLRLLRRMLSLSANSEGILLVPFAGSGSDCVAAKEMGLDFIAFETAPEYVALAQSRLAAPQKDLLARTTPQSLSGNTPKQNGKAIDEVTDSGVIPSLLKWTGSKRSQAQAIAKLIPQNTRYLEPFLGGGAVMYLAGRKGAIGGDLYSPLIEFWNIVKNSPHELCENYSEQWSLLQDELRSVKHDQLEAEQGLPKYYYAVRQRFNKNPNPHDLNFLMRTCVNGIVRFNEDGEFNNSFHLSRPGMEPRRFQKAVALWHRAVANVEFICQDYETTLSTAAAGDFVYLDPPYAGSRQRYVADLDIEKLFRVLESLNSRGIKWGLSFDGTRGDCDLKYEVPQELYRRVILLPSGNSPVNKVLNGPVEMVYESLYTNFEQ
ncbi:MAG: Dam family site-specific DNA-(adenine-N6)-methyltransferase [Pirellulaceae bacterium]